MRSKLGITSGCNYDNYLSQGRIIAQCPDNVCTSVHTFIPTVMCTYHYLYTTCVFPALFRPDPSFVFHFNISFGNGIPFRFCEGISRFLLKLFLRNYTCITHLPYIPTLSSVLLILKLLAKYFAKYGLSMFVVSDTERYEGS